MKAEDFTLNSNGKIRWLSFPSFQKFDFISHGLIIKNKKQNLSKLTKKNITKKLVEKISSEKKRILIPQQVHGNGCVTIKRGEGLKRKYKADALLTDRKDVFLTVSIADCLPIFLVEPKSKVVGLIHAGWRGTLLGIASKTVRKAKIEFGCKPGDLILLFGPAIQKCCYEISEAVAILFDDDCLIRRPHQKPKLNLIKANLKQFVNCGVKRRKIFLTNDCTYCQDDMFHSFRRDGEKSGRMIAFIGRK
jgi:YfiH family protein